MEIPVTHVTMERKIYHVQSVTCTLWELMYLHSVTKPSKDGNLGGYWRAESSTMTIENHIYHDITSVSTFSSKSNQNMTKLAKPKTKLGRPAKMQGLGVVFFAQIPSNVRLRLFSVTLWPLMALLGQYQPALISLSGHCWLHRCPASAHTAHPRMTHHYKQSPSQAFMLRCLRPDIHPWAHLWPQSS